MRNQRSNPTPDVPQESAKSCRLGPRRPARTDSGVTATYNLCSSSAQTDALPSSAQCYPDRYFTVSKNHSSTRFTFSMRRRIGSMEKTIQSWGVTLSSAARMRRPEAQVRPSTLQWSFSPLSYFGFRAVMTPSPPGSKKFARSMSTNPASLSHSLCSRSV